MRSTPRSGATLTEVLMALLIMSVGVVSVFSLFPISILTSIRANQVTNGKILADNVVEQMHARPEFVLGAKYWEPNTSYVENEFVCPRPQNGSPYPNTNMVFRVDVAGTSGRLEPNWPTNTGGGNIADGAGALEWEPFRFSNYVIDELGRITNANYTSTFGNSGTAATGVSRINLQRRLNLSSPEETAFMLDDSWSVVLEATPNGGGASSVTFPSSVDLSGVPSSGRVIMTHVDGIRTMARDINPPVGANSIDVTPNFTAPFDDSDNFLSARIEAFTPRYTWFTTVNRNDTGVTRAQIVVVFNRSFNYDDERAYDYTIGSSRSELTVTWTATDPTPLIREGNYAYDVNNNQWHKIVSAAQSAGDTLVLESSIGGTNTSGTMVFLPGVIGVYEL